MRKSYKILVRKPEDLLRRILQELGGGREGLSSGVVLLTWE
jgi:hypothetical protein